MDICFKKSITLQRWFDPKGFEIRHFFFSLEKFLQIGEIFGFQWTDSFPPVSCILIASFFPYLVFLRNCRLWKKCVKVWVCLLLIQMRLNIHKKRTTPSLVRHLQLLWCSDCCCYENWKYSPVIFRQFSSRITRILFLWRSKKKRCSRPCFDLQRKFKHYFKPSGYHINMHYKKCNLSHSVFNDY